MAVKLSNALNLTQSEFREMNLQNNQKLREALKNPKFKHQPILPKPDIVYNKEFHFLSETLAEKEKLKELKLMRKEAKKAQMPEETPKEENKQPLQHKSDEKGQGDKPMGEKELKEAVAKITISDFSKNTAANKSSLGAGPIQLGNVKDQADLIDRSLSKIRKDDKPIL